MNAIILTAPALRAAVATARTLGAERDNDSEAAAFFIDALNVLEALLDPAHQPVPAAPDWRHLAPLTALSIEAMQGHGGHVPVTEVGPAHAADPPITIPPLPAGPGGTAPAARGTPAAEAAAPESAPAPAPPPVLAAEGATIPEADHAPPR